MERPSYLEDYLFDWELFDVVLGGKSALDANSYLGSMKTKEDVNAFLHSYGFDPDDPVLRAELFGIFQEALQFIKRYFLKEGHPEGLDFKVPNVLYSITDVSELFVMATDVSANRKMEDSLWAGILLKVMHTILHADKDIRVNYFPLIQQQIFDRFYKYITRDRDDNLFLSAKGTANPIGLVDFQTKSKKSRESVIIKLLHKAENVAEEVFDRIGVRFVTHTKLDILRVIKFLHKQNVILPHNIKPSRSHNTLIDMAKLRPKFKSVVREAMRSDLNEEAFMQALEKELGDCPVSDGSEKQSNLHTSKDYRSIHFTCRQLIRYRNPFVKEFYSVRKLAKEQEEKTDLVKQVLALDVTKIARDIRFFYPFEIQIVDQETYRVNTEGEASHSDYKRAQLETAKMRLFGPLIEYTKNAP